MLSTLFTHNFSEVDEICLNTTRSFLCNYIFMPCDLFTGNPRLICSTECNNYLNNRRCNSTFEVVIAAIATDANYLLQPDCNSPLQLLQEFDAALPSSFVGNENCIELCELL